MLLAIGMFDFSIDTALFNQLQRRRNWRHPSGDRVGARAASQFAGPGDDIITLGGLLAPGQIGHAEALDDVALMADAGAAYPLLDGEGYVYGAYVITDLDETKRNFLFEGQALTVDFVITLKRVDDDQGEPAAASAAASA